MKGAPFTTTDSPKRQFVLHDYGAMNMPSPVPVQEESA